MQILEVDDAPVLLAPVEDVEVKENAKPVSIDLSQVFADSDSSFERMTFQAQVISKEKESAVEAEVEQGQLVLSFPESRSGSATVLLVAESEGKKVSTDFLVTVKAKPVVALLPAKPVVMHHRTPPAPLKPAPRPAPKPIPTPAPKAVERKAVDRAPILQNKVSDIAVAENSEPLLLDLSRMFIDPDSPAEALTLQAKVLAEGTAPLKAELNNKQLKLSFPENASGTAKVLIIADSEGKQASISFKVSVVAPTLVPGGRPEALVIQEDAPALGFNLSRLFQLQDLPQGKDRFAGISIALKSNTHPQKVEATLKDNILMLQPKANQTGILNLTLEGHFRDQKQTQNILVLIQAVEDPPVVQELQKPTVAVDAAPSKKSDWYVTLALTPIASVESSESVSRGTALGITKEEQGSGIQLELGRSVRDWSTFLQAWSVFLQVNQTSFDQATYQIIQLGAEWDLAEQFKTDWAVLPYLGLTYGSGTKEWQEPPFGLTGNASDIATANSTVSGIHLGANYAFNTQWSAGLRHQYFMMDFNTKVKKDFDDVSQTDSTMQSTMMVLKYQF